MAIPLCLWCCIAIGFHGFSLVISCSCICILCFESLGDWLGKEEVKGAQGELCGTQQEMKDSDEVQCMSKHNER